MGPDGICNAAVGFTITGIEDEYLIDLTVTIPVVIIKIHLSIGCSHSLYNQLIRVLIVTITVVRTIIAQVLCRCIGTHHVERQLKLRLTVLVLALSLEIVRHRTFEATDSVVLHVHDILILVQVVGSLKRLVLELHKDDQTFLLARIARRLTNNDTALSQTIGTSVVYHLTTGIGF